MQIAIKDVDLCKEFENAASDEQRILAIRRQLEPKFDTKRQLREGSLSESLSAGSVTKKRKRAHSVPIEEEGPIFTKELAALGLPRRTIVIREMVSARLAEKTASEAIVHQGGDKGKLTDLQGD